MKKLFNNYIPILLIGFLITSIYSCTEKLDLPFENETFTSAVDYSKGEDAILPLLGAYHGLYTRGWDEPVTLGIRGDDVNAAGDQESMFRQEVFKYLPGDWNLNAVWSSHYEDIVNVLSSIDEIQKYKAAMTNDALADQYISECRTIRAYLYLNIARAFGGCIIIDQLDNIQNTTVSNKAEVMQYIIDEMTEAASFLPDMNPNKRSDIPGGITKYTAYAIQALAYQELKDYQGVANATAQIINSGEYQLSSDFYHLFKKAGKLNDEIILEFQFSDFNNGEGDSFSHLFAVFGIDGWTPVVPGAVGGWGFYEPTMKYITFMLNRGEKERLETTVIFTPDGITRLTNEYGALPSWVKNENREGDIFNNNNRLLFGSGKFIHPSTELIEGRTDQGSNKNLIAIRYAEILLMYAEALTRGASGNAMSADDAVNLVRTRAGLDNLSGVTTEQVLDEKYAELATEWGTRYYDMIRTEDTGELSFDGKTFTMNEAYFPFPADQISELPQLAEGVTN